MLAKTRSFLLCAALSSWIVTPVSGQDAQDAEALRTTSLRASPASITLQVGETVPFAVTAVDANGQVVDAPVRYAYPRTGLHVGDGAVRGISAGEFEIVVTVMLPAEAGRAAPSVRIPVTIDWPAVTRLETERDEGRLLAGTTIHHRAHAYHADGSARSNTDVRWSSSNMQVASVDAFGYVTAHQAGEVEIRAEYEGASTVVRHRVEENPVVRLEIVEGAERARTGDVISFMARAYDARGNAVDGVPVTWSYTYLPAASIRTPSAPGQVVEGRFLADLEGRYTVLATAGGQVARRNVEVVARDVLQEFEVVGRGSVTHVRSSDHWIFEGNDGRDYAITGTWVADGWAYMWDVTDPGNIFKTDSIQVDARTVNDVKVSPDARYAVMTREGASNRRNGAVILDLANPAHPVIATVFDEGLTGGVHNSWPMNDYLYALSGGEKYIILDIRDIYNPKYVGEYAYPDGRIHDLWVHDGIAYSAQWRDGIVAVDVGNGGWGGTPENPVFISNYVTPGGRTHTTVPYFQESTGRLLVFASDEIMDREGYALPGNFDTEQYDPATGEGGRPMATSGYTHIVDFTDPENPRKIARYNVPEHGTHNMWIEDDILYQGYFESGLRIVDISGELMGNLYTQGREMAVFKPFDPEGWIPNAPFTWGAQLHKGHVFFSDGNTGLWSGKLLPKSNPVF